MTFKFEFEAHRDFQFAKAFAAHFKVTPHGNRVRLPDALGDGYIEEVYLPNGMGLCIHHYSLKQPFEMRRVAGGTNAVITLKFTRSGMLSNLEEDDLLPASHYSQSAEIGTDDLFTKVSFPGKTMVDLLIINLPRETLARIVQTDKDATSIQNILLHLSSFAFYEGMDADMERLLVHVHQINGTESLSELMYTAKVFELMYRLLQKLVSRDAQKIVAIIQKDAEKIYELKNILLSDISLPPHLPELARKSGMSQTKMKRLFKQVFGGSIYDYYQHVRMNEAARLLLSYSVSEVGYKLGFKSLSHFSRLFQKHHLKNPKRYKDDLLSSRKSPLQKNVGYSNLSV